MAEERRQPTYECPDCGTRVLTQRGLSQHRAKVHGIPSPTSSRQRGGGESTAGPVEKPKVRGPQMTEAELTAFRDRLTGHFVALAQLAAGLGLDHTALTLVTRSVDRDQAVQLPNGGALLDVDGRPVVMRRRGIATVMVEHGRRDERIMRGLVAFDRFMSAGDELELGLSLAAAVAADVVPNAVTEGVGVPGTPLRFKPAWIIPDVIEEVQKARLADQVEAQMAAQAAPEVEEERAHVTPAGAPGATSSSPPARPHRRGSAAPQLGVIEGDVTAT